MRAIAFVAVLSMVLLSAAAFAGESATQAERTEVSRTVSTGKSGISFIRSPESTGSKAEVPGLMNYQGTLTDPSGVALDTTIDMTFSIYDDSTGGLTIWTETQPSVQVSAGVFNVLLGSVNGIADTVFKDPVRWLGVQVGGDAELTPRQRIAAVGYAFWAAEADTADFARAPASSDGDWTITGSDMYSAISGNVGIGVTNPDRKLHVVGADAVYPQQLLVASGDAPLDGLEIGFRYDTVPNIYGRFQAWKDGARPLVLQDAGGNVGIGTSSPESKLTVREQGANELQYPLRLTNPDNTGGTATGVLFETEVNDYGKGGLVYERKSSFARGDFHFLQKTSMDHDLPTLTDAVVTVKNNGNVGIGATNPSHKLQVEGITWTEGLELPASSGADTNYVGVDGNFIAFGHSMVSEDFIGYKNQTFYFKDSPGGGDTSDPNVVIGGKVGIGTDSPSAKLDVYSPLSTPTVIYGEKAIGASSAAGVMGISGTRNFGYLGGEMGTSTEPFSDFNYGVYGRTQEVGWGGFGGMFYNTSGNWAALAGDGSVGYDYAVYGEHSSGSYGYLGSSDYGPAVYGEHSGGNHGYLGGSDEGVYGYSSGGSGVWGYSSDVVGVYGSCNTGHGVDGVSISSIGVYGSSNSGHGVYGSSSSGVGVYGEHSGGNYGYLGGSYEGVYGYSSSLEGVYGYNESGPWGYIASSTKGVCGLYDMNTYGYLGSSSYGGYMSRSGSSGNALYASMNHTGTSPGYGYGLYVDFQCDTSGTSYLESKSGIRTASPYTLASDANYLFAVSGEQYVHLPRRGGGVLGVFTDSQWGCLAYTSSGGSYYGAYFTSYGTGTGNSGIGFGSSAELLGGWVKGELYGLYASGERYASYTDGNTFSNGYGAALHDVAGRERVATFTPTSMEVDIYAHGVGTLNKGFCSVMFEDGFQNIVSDQVPVTVTVTPMGPCQQVYLASVDKGGFSVRESGDGKSSVQFAWIAIGRRRGFENRPEIPAELTEPDFDANMRGFAYNEGDLDGQARSMWHDGISLRWDTPPPSPVPVEKLRQAEQKRRVREREEEEVRRLEEKNQKRLVLQKEERLKRERRLEAEAELKPMRKAPTGENTSGPTRRQRENR